MLSVGPKEISPFHLLLTLVLQSEVWKTIARRGLAIGAEESLLETGSHAVWSAATKKKSASFLALC